MSAVLVIGKCYWPLCKSQGILSKGIMTRKGGYLEERLLGTGIRQSLRKHPYNICNREKCRDDTPVCTSKVSAKFEVGCLMKFIAALCSAGQPP